MRMRRFALWFAWDENAKIGVFPMLSHNLWDNININR